MPPARQKYGMSRDRKQAHAREFERPGLSKVAKVNRAALREALRVLMTVAGQFLETRAPGTNIIR